MSSEANRAQLGFLGWLPHGVLDMICTYLAISDVPLLLLLPPPISSCIDRIASLLDYSELCRPSKSWHLLFWAACVSKLPHTTLVCIFNIVSEMLCHLTHGFNDMIYIARMWKIRRDEMPELLRDEKSSAELLNAGRVIVGRDEKLRPLIYITQNVRLEDYGIVDKWSKKQDAVFDVIDGGEDYFANIDFDFSKSIVVAIGLERHRIIEHIQKADVVEWRHPYRCAVMSRNKETIRCVIELMCRQDRFYDLMKCALCALEHKRFDDYVTFRYKLTEESSTHRDNVCVNFTVHRNPSMVRKMMKEFSKHKLPYTSFYFYAAISSALKIGRIDVWKDIVAYTKHDPFRILRKALSAWDDFHVIDHYLGLIDDRKKRTFVKSCKYKYNSAAIKYLISHDQMKSIDKEWMRQHFGVVSDSY